LITKLYSQENHLFFCMRTNEKCLIRAYTGRNRNMIPFRLCYVNDDTVRTVNMHCQSSVSMLSVKIVEITLNIPLCVITEMVSFAVSKSSKLFHVNWRINDPHIHGTVPSGLSIYQLYLYDTPAGLAVLKHLNTLIAECDPVRCTDAWDVLCCFELFCEGWGLATMSPIQESWDTKMGLNFVSSIYNINCILTINRIC
jgi:hypothetical protein